VATDSARRLAVLLEAYTAAGPEEESHRLHILEHLAAEPLWWHRDTLPGHVTGSAFVVDPALERMLLVHHRRLGRWLQPGGHDEGEEDPAATALREVREETGIREPRCLGRQPAIFDLDVHPIPAGGPMPRHLHLDVRFLFLADPGLALCPGPGESPRLAWFPLAEALARLGEASARRVGRKLAELQAALAALRASPEGGEDLRH